MGWDTNLIPATQEIDYQVKQDILGSRRNILFVEGKETSLDKAIYTILYLMAPRLTFADIAIFPFVRQWASVEGGNLQAFEHVEAWLHARTDSALFRAIMK